MIKIIMGLIIIIILIPLARYWHLDTQFNNSTITDQIRNDGYEILTDVINFAERSHAQRH